MPANDLHRVIAETVEFLESGEPTEVYEYGPSVGGLVYARTGRRVKALLFNGAARVQRLRELRSKLRERFTRASRTPELVVIAETLACGGDTLAWMEGVRDGGVNSEARVLAVDPETGEESWQAEYVRVGVLDALNRSLKLFPKITIRPEPTAGGHRDEAGSGAADAGGKGDNDRPEPAGKEAKALGILATNPGWSDVEIARAVPCSRGSLYRWKKFQAARALLREGGKAELAHGAKRASGVDAERGGLEAWDEDDRRLPTDSRRVSRDTLRDT